MKLPIIGSVSNLLKIATTIVEIITNPIVTPKDQNIPLRMFSFAISLKLLFDIIYSRR